MNTPRARTDDIPPLHIICREGSMPWIPNPHPISSYPRVESCSAKPAGYLASSSSYNLRRFATSLHLGSAPIGLQVDMTIINAPIKAIRPLPPIPTVASPSSSATQFSPRGPLNPRVIRPLPSPPASPSHPATPSASISQPQPQNAVATPATTLPALSVTLASDTTFSPNTTPPSSPPRAASSRPKLPPLVTNTELLKPPSPTEAPSSANSPATPQPPTPQTAKRKRMSKLRRHLGEPIPEDAVPIIQVTALSKQKALERLENIGGDSVYLRAAITVGKILDIQDDENNSDGSGDGGDDDDAYSWRLGKGKESRVVSRRQSRRWVREKGGQRWEEPSYDNILRALRAL